MTDHDKMMLGAVTRICARARWSTGGSHASAVEEELEAAYEAGRASREDELRHGFAPPREGRARAVVAAGAALRDLALRVAPGGEARSAGWHGDCNRSRSTRTEENMSKNVTRAQLAQIQRDRAQEENYKARAMLRRLLDAIATKTVTPDLTGEAYSLLRGES